MVIKKLLITITLFALFLSLLSSNVSANANLSADEIYDMKECVSSALLFGDSIRNYFPNIAIWIEEYNYFHTDKLPYYADTLIHVNEKTYLLLYENLLPGGSYENMCNYAERVFTADIAQKAKTQAYLDSHQPLFYISNEGKLYIASPETLITYYFFDEHTSDTLELLSVSDDYAIGRICLYVTYTEEETAEYELFHQYPAWVECKFEKTNSGWKIADSAFSDMIISKSFDRTYCSEDNLFSPSTSDPAFDRIALLSTVSLACLVPAFCLLRRKRRNVIG